LPRGRNGPTGVADREVDVAVDEPAAKDVAVYGAVVFVRATRDGGGDGRVYTVTAAVTDVAGNVATRTGACVVPHHRGP